MSTIGPTAARELAAEARSRDVELLDAPVSGSVSVAAQAQLFVMVGGDREAYERAAPVLDAMAKGHVLLGPSGSGAAMKLAVNAMIAVTNEAVAETLVLAESFGIAREAAYDVLAGRRARLAVRPLQAGRVPASRRRNPSRSRPR